MEKTIIMVNEKTSKQGLIDYLKGAKVSDKSLAERVKYALGMVKKDLTKVTKADLYELAQEVMGSLTPAPVEASVKPKKTLGKKKPAQAESTEQEEPAKAEEPAPKKTTTAKKIGTAKTTPPKKETKEEVETLPPVSSKGSDNLPSAKIFPKEIKHPDLGKLVSCAGSYNTYAEIVEALKAERTLYFACYWTKRQIKEFGYEAVKMVKAPKNGFPYDLDILVAVLPCETIERLFAMSSYTEALFQFEGEDFAPIEDVDPRSGDKFKIRVSAGMEFEIYRPEDEDVYTESEE